VPYSNPYPDPKLMLKLDQDPDPGKLSYPEHFYHYVSKNEDVFSQTAPRQYWEMKERRGRVKFLDAAAGELARSASHNEVSLLKK
jgi:hypothetical protein